MKTAIVLVLVTIVTQMFFEEKNQIKHLPTRQQNMYNYVHNHKNNEISC